MNDTDPIAERNALARRYQARGELDRVIALFETNLRECADLRGADSADTLAARNGLAAAHQQAGRPADAVPLLERGHAVLRSSGPDHPYAPVARANLATAYRAAGRDADALNSPENG